MAQWHGLAKLRLHTDGTLTHLDKLTSRLGDQLRKFKKRTCSVFDTKELPRETRARENTRTKDKAAKRRSTAKQPAAKAKSTTKPLVEHPKPKPMKREFSLNTYKNHALGDYVEMIRRYGTTDLYTTELVSPLFGYLCIRN